MRDDEDEVAAVRDSWFLRAAAAVGDLGNPFYAEERQRDVWDEASAVGFQLVLWLGLAAATGMVWAGGAQGLPYALTVFAVVGLASLVAVRYAQDLGVRVDDAARLLRLRLVPYVALLLLFLVGVLRAAPAGGFGRGLALGAVGGTAAAVVALVVGVVRDRRTARRR